MRAVFYFDTICGSSLPRGCLPASAARIAADINSLLLVWGVCGSCTPLVLGNCEDVVTQSQAIFAQAFEPFSRTSSQWRAFYCVALHWTLCCLCTTIVSHAYRWFQSGSCWSFKDSLLQQPRPCINVDLASEEGLKYIYGPSESTAESSSIMVKVFSLRTAESHQSQPEENWYR